MGAIDSHSKWLEVCPMASTTDGKVTLTQFCIPDMAAADNGTNFVSAQFLQFMHHNGVRHMTSIRANPASNRLAERAVKSFKEGLERMKEGSLADQLSTILSGIKTADNWSILFEQKTKIGCIQIWQAG